MVDLYFSFLKGDVLSGFQIHRNISKELEYPLPGRLDSGEGQNLGIEVL